MVCWCLLRSLPDAHRSARVSIELLEAGRITLPMPAAQQGFTMAIRRGEVDLNEVLTRAGDLEQRTLISKTPRRYPRGRGVYDSRFVKLAGLLKV